MDQQTFLVTGVSSGIGKSFVQLANTHFPDTKIIALTRSKLDYALPRNVEAHYVDLTNFTDVEKVMKKVLKKHGPIQVLINNAGNGWKGTIEDTAIDEAKQQLDVNVWAAVNLIQLVLPGMRAQNSGHIINVSSVAATIDFPTMAYYGATKTFLEKISRILAMEVRAWNIQISIVIPGTIKTKFGRNMLIVKQFNKSDYGDLYAQWGDKFAAMFRHPISSDQVARKIIKTIEHRQNSTFVVRRDRIYCYLKLVLPGSFYNRYNLKRYMHDNF